MTITHLHVSDTKNKGDVGIVIAVQELLKKTFPQTSIRNIPLIHLKTGLSASELKDINKTDLVIIGGGGIYYRWFLPFHVPSIKKIKPPICIMGVGYIRELGSKDPTLKETASIVTLNKKAALSSVRDFNSKKWLVKNGVPSKRIDVIGDPAIFLSEQRPPYFKKKAKINIGLNLNYSGWLGFGQYENEIIGSYNSVIAHFESIGAHICYLLHHPDEKRIYQKLQSKNMTIIDASPRVQKYIYGTMDLIIGMMLHSVVMAFGAGTPAINVGYDLRNKSFARFIKHPELEISANKLKITDLLARAQQVFDNRGEYKKALKRRKDEIWKKQEAFLNKIKQRA